MDIWGTPGVHLEEHNLDIVRIVYTRRLIGLFELWRYYNQLLYIGFLTATDVYFNDLTIMHMTFILAPQD